MVPLSEHEQRMLDQIESALYAEDPKFASNVRGGRVGVAVGRRRIAAIVGFVVGLILLLTGLLLPNVQLTAAVSIAGFLLMFGSVVVLLWAPSARGSGPRGSVNEDGSVKKSKGSRSGSGGGSSFSTRMEERFRRRFP